MHNSEKTHFLVKVILAFMPILVVLAICEILLHHCDNEYKYKNEWLSQNAKDVQVLILGPSHTRTGINPSYLSEKAFNAASMAQDFKYDYLIFSKFIKQMESLRYVILPVSYATILHSLDSSSEKGYIHYYILEYNFDNQPFHLNNCFYFCHSNSIMQLFQNDTPTYAKLGNGITSTSTSRTQGWEKIAPATAKSHSASSYPEVSNKQILTIYSQNLNYAQQIVNLCEERNVHVILLTTPTYKTYWENIDPKQYDMMLNFCKQLQDEHSNVSYLNMMKDERFGYDDFYDCHHLSVDYGAIKLSTILNDYIMNTLEPQRATSIIPATETTTSE